MTFKRHIVVLFKIMNNALREGKKVLHVVQLQYFP